MPPESSPTAASRPAPTRPHTPWVPAERNLPELTLKAIVLGVVLAGVLAAANAYLGLFAGMTVSASIPAAVVSMAVLRLFRQSNILENNIVQTAASAGEGVAAGAIFTLPALIMVGAWQSFAYWETALLTGLGGTLGVLFTIPLRRALIIEEPLQFPEGVATAEVLKVGERKVDASAEAGQASAGGRAAAGASGVGFLAGAAVLGALYKLGASGLRLWGEILEGGRAVGTTVAYFGINLSPALLAVGYIVGLEIAILMMAGAVINFWIVIPILTLQQGGLPAGVGVVDHAATMWSQQTRYLGVGAMLVGGLWALISLRKSLFSGIRSSLEGYRRSRAGGDRGGVSRTERDVPMVWVGWALVASLVPLFFTFWHFSGASAQSTGERVVVSALVAVLVLVAGFLFSAVAGYMAGLVGSSNNPISGVTLATVLTSAVVLLLVVGRDSVLGPAATVLVGVVVCCAAAIAGDNLQDLKAGYIVGATPWKQQVMLIVGTLTGALLMAPVLTVLLEAYGIGEARVPNVEPLAAPQATLVAAVARGVFGGGLPLDMVALGAGIAVAVILFDLWLERRGAKFRAPVLAVAVGIYLPFDLEVPILIGGILAWLAGRTVLRRSAREAARSALPGALAPLTAATRGDEGSVETTPAERAKQSAERRGLLFAAGLITGEALLGILLAIPIWLTSNREVLALGLGPWSWLGLLLLAAVSALLFRTGSRGDDEDAGAGRPAPVA